MSRIQLKYANNFMIINTLNCINGLPTTFVGTQDLKPVGIATVVVHARRTFKEIGDNRVAFVTLKGFN